MNDKSLGSQNTSCLRLLEMLTENQNNDAHTLTSFGRFFDLKYSDMIQK